MANSGIVNYLKQGLNKGFSEEQLKRKLFESGWTNSQVNDALQQIHGNSPKKENSKKPKTLVDKNKNNPNNALLYILGGVLLVIVVVLIVLVTSVTQKISEEDLEAGTTADMKEGKTKKFSLDEQKHEMELKSVQNDRVTVEIRSDPIEVELTLGETKKVNINNDDYYDLKLKAQSTENDELEIYMERITESVCSPSWDCSQWSSCDNGIQTRNCSDTNECGTEEGMPNETQECCEENWTCTNWTECINETQTRNCTDENECGSEENKPSESKECENDTQTNVLENCSELEGNLCNSSEICNGTELNSSDDSVCCNGSCVLNETEGICSDGYSLCGESEYCNASLEEGPGEPVCCSEECMTLTYYLTGKSFENLEGSDINDLSYSKEIGSFQNSILNDCEEGTNITVEGSSDMGGASPQGKILNITTYYELKGLNQNGNCTISGNITEYSSYNYTQKLRNYLIQKGNTTEEIQNALEEQRQEMEKIENNYATCHYPLEFLNDTLEQEWKEEIRYNPLRMSMIDGEETFNCTGDYSNASKYFVIV